MEGDMKAHITHIVYLISKTYINLLKNLEKVDHYLPWEYTNIKLIIWKSFLKNLDLGTIV